MLAHDVIIENFTSPAARIPYAGMNDNTHDIGLVIVMKRVISKHILALSASIPPSMVIGRHNANTTRQLIIMAASAILLSFFIYGFIFSSGSNALTNYSHKSNTYTLCGNSVKVFKNIGHSICSNGSSSER
jgi:hypothetical protein